MTATMRRVLPEPRTRTAAKSHRCDARGGRCTGWIGRGERYTQSVYDERLCARCAPLPEEASCSR